MQNNSDPNTNKQKSNLNIAKLVAINNIVKTLALEGSPEQTLKKICELIPLGYKKPEEVKVRVSYDKVEIVSKGFQQTPWFESQVIKIPGDTEGLLEVYHLQNSIENYNNYDAKENKEFLSNVSQLISGIIFKPLLKKLVHEKRERIKELTGINRTASILEQTSTLEETFQQICAILPDAWQYPEHTVVKITYGKKEWKSENFKETKWFQEQDFHTYGNKKGQITVYYLKKFPIADEGPFLKEERDLLMNVANLIAGSATKISFKDLFHANKERLKELKAINRTSSIISEGRSVAETLEKTVNILPASWQYPKYTAARIYFEDKYYTSPNFEETKWCQKESFTTIDSKKGSIEIYYLKEFSKEYEGPFLKEERNLLINIAKLISGYLNNYKGREILQYKNYNAVSENYKSEEFRKSLMQNKRPLQLFFNQQIIDKYIYLDMMKYKVKEILFVATLYDAYILENEESFFEQFMGEIYQYSLFSLPRITGVTSGEEAMEILQTKRFDLVILMVSIDTHAPLKLSEKIKQKLPQLPIYLLLNNKSYVKCFEELVPVTLSIDKLFVWQGHSQIFFAMVKSIEDNINAENDTKIGLVRIILLIEDSAEYYSRYLQSLYSIVFEQIQNLLPEVEKNELDKICKMRSRPKILHATNYEEATYIFNKYKDFLLCVISDVEFERNGALDKAAGVKFIKYAKSHIKNLPVILQSSENNVAAANDLGIAFINKNSKGLRADLKAFLTDYIFFGNFIFKDKDGNQIAVAKSLREFEMLLHKIPGESLYAHAMENQFSLWLMSRGEIELARHANPIKVSDFNSLEEFRRDIIHKIKRYKEVKKRGKVLSFDETAILDEKNIISLSGGSFGGKGRGLAFINALINNLDFSVINKQINIRSPLTAFIGTDEFEYFLDKNNLREIVFNNGLTYREIRKLFVKGSLSAALIQKLSVFLDQVSKPIAIRSSSISEDSITQPFAGVFDTYIVPNNEKSKKARMDMLVKAIKLVYASVYSDDARTYFMAISHKVEEERMAVILQEVVGKQYGNYFYPHISGTAQSYNYYPVGSMKPEEGFANIAIGLGHYVVGGNKSYRFSPKYPGINIYSTKDLLNSTQVEFLAVNLSKNNIDLLNHGELASLELLDVGVAEHHGTIKHCISHYNPDNDRIEAAYVKAGPRIVNFANILKFNYIPLAQTVNVILNMIKEALGSPVEIEFAVDLDKTVNKLPSFYLLQIKPLLEEQLSDEHAMDKINKEQCVLYSQTSLGNGVIKNIHDIIFVDISKFNKLQTMEMVSEIQQLNERMGKQEKQYILIGPGRWGTSDRFLGIPVNWAQISNAKVIVEMSLSNFPLDASLGSHFFHNISSMNIGYFSVLASSMTDFIKWDIIQKQKIIHKTRFFTHIRFDNPLEIIMNGKQKTAAITYK